MMIGGILAYTTIVLMVVNSVLMNGIIQEEQISDLPKETKTDIIRTTGGQQCINYCLEHPQSSNCSSCTYPSENTTHDINMLCSMMPSMIGCSVHSHCMGKQVSGKYCDEFSILGDICTADPGMGMMHGCGNYNKLCNTNGTVIKECKSKPPIPNMIGTTATISGVIQACSQMNMPGCQYCKSQSDCSDPLLAISLVCKSMYMKECNGWEKMCQSITDSKFQYFCGTKGEDLVEMRMYFHTGIKDYIWFKGWVPQNNLQYYLTAIFVVLLGIFTQFLKALRAVTLQQLKIRNERKKNQRNKSKLMEDPSDHHDSECTEHIDMKTPAINTASSDWSVLSKYRKPLSHVRRNIFCEIIYSMVSSFKKEFFIWGNIVRFLCGFVITGLDYFLMLAAMTYNFGIFISVLIGFGLGHFLFGHVVASSGEESDVIDTCCE